MVGRKKKIHSLQIKSLETKILPTSRCILEICKAAFVHKKGCIACGVQWRKDDCKGG